MKSFKKETVPNESNLAEIKDPSNKREKLSNVKPFDNESSLAEINASNSSISDEQGAKLLNMRPSATVRAVIAMMLITEKLDATRVLVSSIRNMTSIDHIYLACLALREGANPNVYVSIAGGKSSPHIMVYLHMIRDSNKMNDNLFTLMILCLLASGSEVGLQSYTANGPSVETWVANRKYPKNILALLIPDFKSSIDEHTKRQVGILTGRLDLLDNIELTDKEATVAIKALSSFEEHDIGDEIRSILEYMPYSRDLEGIDYSILFDCVKYYDEYTFDYYCSIGALPQYPLISMILIKAYKKEHVPELINSLGSMVASAINYGYELDIHQKSLLETMNKDISKEILKAYSKPRWRKACSIKNNIYELRPSPDMIKIMTLIRGDIRDNYDLIGICSFLRLIVNKNKNNTELIIQALSRKRRALVLGNYGYPGEFIDDHVAMVNIVNQNVLDEDAYSYVSSVFTREGNGDLYCFPHSMYASILETKRHPYTDEYLTESTMDEIKRKINDIEYKTWKSLISVLLENDQITNNSSDYIVKEFVKEAGISQKEFKSSSIASLPEYKQYMIGDLTDEHALSVISRIASYSDKYKEEIINSLKSEPEPEKENIQSEKIKVDISADDSEKEDEMENEKDQPKTREKVIRRTNTEPILEQTKETYPPFRKRLRGKLLKR